MQKKRLGISLYPGDKCTDEQCIAYMERAASHGFDVLFLAMFMADEGRDELVKRYLPLTTRAKELGFEIHVDVNPAFLKQIGVKTSILQGGIDLSFFTELKIDAMRLDMGMSDMEEAFLTKNKEGVIIDLNGCSETDHVGAVIAAGGDPNMLVGCYNYYPHAYTGLSLDYFVEKGRFWTDKKLRLQTFVTSQAEGSFGPWPVDDGIPTLEMHRNLPISVQTKHFMMMDGITDILISNCFATDEELAAMEAANTASVQFSLDLVDGLPAEQADRLKMPLSMRFDCTGGYLVRTLESRMNPLPVEPFNCVDVKRGDVLIDNTGYGQYRGEVQIALQDMPADPRVNVVAHIVPEEHMLLDYLKPNKSFGFTF